MKRSHTIVAASALLALSAASSADAQRVPDQFQVVLHAGWQTYAEGSGLTSGPTVGGEATYYISEAIGVGLWTDFAIAESDGSLLTPAALSFVDSTTFYSINQGVDIWGYGVQGKLQLPWRAAPYVLAGAGGYTVFLDPQQNSGNSSTSGFVLRFGGGVDFAVTDAIGVQLAVFDVFYPDWDPNVLQPVRPQFQNTRFPELNPDPSRLSESVHNFKFIAGFTLVPGF
jgi:opacity protein-like surface antigen